MSPNNDTQHCTRTCPGSERTRTECPCPISCFPFPVNWIEELGPNVITSPPAGLLAASVSTSSGAQLETPPQHPPPHPTFTQGGAGRSPGDHGNFGSPTAPPLPPPLLLPSSSPCQIPLPACTSPPQGKSPC